MNYDGWKIVTMGKDAHEAPSVLSNPLASLHTREEWEDEARKISRQNGEKFTVWLMDTDGDPVTRWINGYPLSYDIIQRKKRVQRIVDGLRQITTDEEPYARDILPTITDALLFFQELQIDEDH